MTFEAVTAVTRVITVFWIYDVM